MKAKYVRWPGDADPSDASFAEGRRYAERMLQRGPKTLRNLIADGYVSEIVADPDWYGLLLFGPEGYHNLAYTPSGYISVRKWGSPSNTYFDNVRSAAAFFKALVDEKKKVTRR